MALTWDLTEIANHEELCWQPLPPSEEGRGKLHPVTYVLTLLCGLHLGISHLTAENVESAYERYVALCRALGVPLGVSAWRTADLEAVGGPFTAVRVFADRLVTLDEFRAHIGLKTNGVVYSDAEFRRHLLEDIILPDAHRQLASAKANPTHETWTATLDVKEPR